jgi:hypothetical protein
MRYLPCGPPLVGTALMPVGRHAIHFTIPCNGLGKLARGACESRELSRHASARTSGSQPSTGRSPDCCARISPLSYPDHPLVPYIILYPNQTRRWRAAQTIRSRVDLIACPPTWAQLGQVSAGLCEADDGHTSTRWKRRQRAGEPLGSPGSHSAIVVRIDSGGEVIHAWKSDRIDHRWRAEKPGT